VAGAPATVPGVLGGRRAADPSRPVTRIDRAPPPACEDPSVRTVVGGLILEGRRVLAARRRAGSHAGRWEFPGGKVEPGETPQEALRRELREELDLDVEVGEEVRAPDGAWPISEVLELRLFRARVRTGTPGPGPDHDAVRWLAPDQLDDLAWLPSDEQALPAVRAALGDLG